MGESAGRVTTGVASKPTSPDDIGKPLTVEIHGHTIEIEPGSPLASCATPAYRRAYANYLLTGVSEGLQTSSGPSGGYMVAPPQVVAELIKNVDDLVFMRTLGKVLPPIAQGASAGVVSLDADPGDAEWTSEVPASDIAEDTSMVFGKRELTPHGLTKLIKVSKKFLRAATTSPESLINERMAYKFGITEEKAYLLGNGDQRPPGVYVASNDGVPATRDITSTKEASFTADDWMKVQYSFKDFHWNNVTWILHRDIVFNLRTLKNGQGDYVWSRGLNGTEAGASFIFSDDEQVRKIGYIGAKRYVRLTITPVANAGNSDISATAILSHARKRPHSSQS